MRDGLSCLLDAGDDRGLSVHRRILFILSAVALAILFLASCGETTTTPTNQQAAENLTENTNVPSDLSSVEPSSKPRKTIWPALSIFSLLVTLLSLTLAFQMIRWRRRLPNGQISLVPEEIIKITEHAASMNRQQIVEERERGNELHAMMAEIREAFGVFGETVAKKDGEINRLKSGGDRQATIEFAKRFIRVARLAQSDIREDTAANRDTSALESILLHLTEALRDAGFEPFEIELGTDYRNASSVAKGPEIVKTEDASLDWQIAEVIHPGFHTQTADGPLVVEPAVVQIYRHSQ